MSKIRVHELARELGRQNKEIMELLKAKGVDVKSHMSCVEEPYVSMIKEKFSRSGKEKTAKLDTPKTEEKVTAANTDAAKTEAPKKKKNIIRVYHAQNASDGGKNRRKPFGDKEKRGQARPQGTNPQRPAAPKQAAAPKPAPEKPKTEEVSVQEKPAVKPAKPAETSNRPAAENAGRQNTANTGRPQPNRDNRENRTDGRNNERRPSDRFGQNRQPRQSQGEGQGQNRQPRQGQGEGNGRFQKQGENRGFNRGQSRQSQGAGSQGRFQGGNDRRNDSRPDGRGENRSSEGRENRFQGGTGRQGQRSSQRKSSSADAVFTPELTKTSKDSKRERDRENKNKKKDFEKTQGGGRRPNQGGFKQNARLPKALQKPTPQPKQEEKKPEVKEITLPEKMTIRELAEAMKMQPSVIVKKLFMQGIMVTVNHEIDFEKAQEIALDFDIIAEQEEKVDVIEELLKEEEEDESTMESRPPVVCVMGHVDHGKTSLLDAIRNTNVTRGEAGGITQHIGAYVVKINDQKITFLDTPGHEAFTAMRMRGANATDIAVLVVAADDGVMPQTVEAISHAKAAGVEIIVAINKIDKPSANVERVKQELSEYELIPEDWGGSTVFVPVSAKTGDGIDNLLEMILLTAEVCELKANPKRSARGLVIEAQLDKGKGPVATILVQKGTLHVGDFIAAGACSGKVRAMMDDKGRRVKEAGPSTPVEILGLGDVPNAGEILMSFDSDKEAKNFAGAFVSENKNRLLEETKGKLSLDNLFDQIQASDLKELPLIVKADVQGSVEAVKQSLTKLSNEEVIVKVIHGGVGAINESDVSLAATSNAIIIGFNVRPDTTAKQLAEQENVDLRLYRVIYQAIEDVEAAMKGMLDPIFEEKVIGHAEVRQLFKASGVGTIAGSYILDGVFQRNCKVRISREGEQLFEGELASLKRFKDDVKEVKAGFECGLVFDGFNDLKEEDKVEAYIMVEVPR
ncbi:MAG: translation initiation factor IF-2 [Blautia sp.]|nr:translation initiation factor IF-2 [Blautia sp.]